MNPIDSKFDFFKYLNIYLILLFNLKLNCIEFHTFIYIILHWRTNGSIHSIFKTILICKNSTTIRGIATVCLNDFLSADNSSIQYFDITNISLIYCLLFH